MAWTLKERMDRLTTRRPELKPVFSHMNPIIVEFIICQTLIRHLPAGGNLGRDKNLDYYVYRSGDANLPMTYLTPPHKNPLMPLLYFFEEQLGMTPITDMEMEPVDEIRLAIRPPKVKPAKINPKKRVLVPA